MELDQLSKKASYTSLRFQSKLGKEFGKFRDMYIPVYTKTWRYLFKEIFIREIYKFESEKESPFIIDCGANIGFAVTYFKSLYPQSRVLCFEASSETHGKLLRTLQMNKFDDVKVVQRALTDKAGMKVKFFKNSIDNCDLGASLNSKGLSECEEVETVQLSQYITEAVDYLKIDIEGAEAQVFKDLVESGKLHFVKQGLLEFHMSKTNPDNDLAFILRALNEHHFSYRFLDSEEPGLPWRDEQLLLIAFKRAPVNGS